MAFKRSLKGSITVFLSLITVMILALIMSLIEVVHFSGLSKQTEVVSKIGTESVFGDFNRALYKDYGILAIDGGYGSRTLDIARLEERIVPYLDDNINPEGRLNYLRAVSEVELTDYGVLTDEGGASFIKSAAITMMSELPEDIINSWRSVSKDLESAGTLNSDVEDLLLESKNSMNNAKEDEEIQGEDLIESTLTPDKQDQFERNGSPIDAILKFKSRAVLGQVLGDLSSLSMKETGDDLPSKREAVTWNQTGNHVNINSGDKAMYALYLKKYFGSFRNPKKDGGLEYQWEYVVAGKNSDIKNLEAVVVRLLALREAENLIAVAADQSKVTEAYGIATAICAGLAIPALIEPVKWGVLAAWAYLESVLDVRLLLQGGKVALIKSPAEWTSNILLFPNYIRTDVCAYESPSGMDYEDYLITVCMLMTNRELGLRGLDVIETSLKTLEEYGDIRMENFIYRGDFLFTYRANPIFASVMPITSGRLSTYEFIRAESLSYI